MSLSLSNAGAPQGKPGPRFDPPGADWKQLYHTRQNFKKDSDTFQSSIKIAFFDVTE